jgi:hypothetical protein
VPVPEVHDGRARVAREPLLEAMSRLAPTPRGPEAA